MELLVSNYPPMKTRHSSFSDAFYDYVSRSKKVDIAVGYVTADSLAELQQLAEFNKDKIINLTIGMHYYDLFTRNEYNAARELNSYLLEHDQGAVNLVTPFRYHGKLYSFSNERKPFASIIGSNNLSSIVNGGARVYEAAAILDDEKIVKEINEFINNLVETSADNLNSIDITNFKEGKSPLDGQESVIKISDDDRIRYLSEKTDVSFEIPLKPFEDSPKSNLNAFLGEGRKGKNGLIKPRNWYEIEVIVSNKITSMPGYPGSKKEIGSFMVVTDDGWSFKCYVGGTNKKNFRSESDLKILGRWIKGRLESAGVINVGQITTRETLDKYGRDNFTLTKTKNSDIWILDFGVKKNEIS